MGDRIYEHVKLTLVKGPGLSERMEKTWIGTDNEAKKRKSIRS